MDGVDEAVSDEPDEEPFELPLDDVSEPPPVVDDVLDVDVEDLPRLSFL